ncbi:hypothetical protein BDL97_02G008800 [Sphagnum fallax]|nr:hypothetical protein BDL97_02G008800 [Sphagnum fallax]
MAEEEEEEEEEEQQLSSTSRSNGNSSFTLLPKEYVNLEDVANRYLSEEIIPLQDVAGVQGAKQQNYSEKKLEQKCGTTKQMQQIAAAADNRQNASFDSNTQCHTATDMFNDMHGTSTELVENETNYTGPAMRYDGPKHASKMGNTDAGTGTDGGHTGRWMGGIEYGTFKGV